MLPPGSAHQQRLAGLDHVFGDIYQIGSQRERHFSTGTRGEWFQDSRLLRESHDRSSLQGLNSLQLRAFKTLFIFPGSFINFSRHGQTPASGGR